VWDGQPERACRRVVDSEFEFCGLFDGQVRRPGAAKDPENVDGALEWRGELRVVASPTL
jgi:hypothetical protein